MKIEIFQKIQINTQAKCEKGTKESMYPEKNNDMQSVHISNQN